MRQGWIGNGLRALAAVFLICPSLPAQNKDTRLVRETEALSPELERDNLRVPEGFSVHLFAAEPQINKPINIAFDTRGRLWVSSTVEYPYAAPRDRWVDAEGSRVKDSRDAIKILEDTDGDGRADKVTDFADGLNIPTGVLPWAQPGDAAGCIAWSIPNIWYFGDQDGDGRCDTRRVLFGPLGFEKDTHGMCSSFRMGHDGWVYATHGFNNTSQIRVRPENLRGAQPGDPGTTLDLHSGNVFRFRPDGSRVEIWSWGQVNPFGLAWDRRGYLYSADCHSAPIYQLLRGAHYPSFGKPHDGLGFAPGMCAHTHGSTGICGIAIRDDHRWGPDWDERIFIGNVVTSRVNADLLEWRGATPVAVEQPDFVVSDDPWFRPVDLRFGPDGALYVADFYNRIIGHYEVPLDHPGRDRERGRIWRIVKDGPVGPVQAPTLAAVMPDTAVEMLAAPDPHDRRAAADLLQAQPQAEALAALAVALQEAGADDTHLRHALKLAIREHLRLPGTFEKLSDLPAATAGVDFSFVALSVPSPAASAYLIGQLEKMPATDEAWKTSALGHVGRHGNEYQTNRAIALAKREADAAAQTARLAALHAGRLEREGAVLTPDLSAWALALARGFLTEEKPEAVRDWNVVPHSDFPKSDSPWGLQTRRGADGSDINVLSSLRQGENQAEQRTGVLKSRNFAAPAKLSLWLCGHRGQPKNAPHDRNLVRIVRADTGDVIATAFPPRNDIAQEVIWDLSKASGVDVRIEIVDGDNGGSYAWLGIGRIDPPVLSVDGFVPSDSRDASLRSLAQILRHTAPVDLREKLAAFLPPAPAPPSPVAVSPEQRAETDRLIAARVGQFKAAKPDPAKGRAIFTAHCAVCHQISGEGGLIGPQLDGIGKRGFERLCDDILDPNRNVDAHFHLHTITLKDGATTGGFVRSETAQVIRLIDPTGREYPVKKADIAQSQVSPLSLMPPNFGILLDEAAFRDLLGWLLEKE